jgi:serine/threonine-protein kinase RsbW
MYKNIRIVSDVTNLRIVEKAIDEMTNEMGISQDNYGKILVSNNAIMHGNKSNPDKVVDIEIAFKTNVLKITVEDEGQGFRPEEVPDPTLPENIEEINGRGVYLMSRLSDKLKFSKRGNRVTMMFKNLSI